MSRNKIEAYLSQYDDGMYRIESYFSINGVKKKIDTFIDKDKI